jgi:glycogen debranching enzyme
MYSAASLGSMARPQPGHGAVNIERGAEAKMPGAPVVGLGEDAMARRYPSEREPRRAPANFGDVREDRSPSGHNGGIASPLDTAAPAVPFAGTADLLTLVEGREFVISDAHGDVRGGVHGFVYDDIRHLSHFVLTAVGERLAPIASAATAPFEAVVVHRLHDGEGEELSALLVRRRHLARGVREDLELWSTDRREVSVQLSIEFGADFAHIFDVKAGRGRAPASPRADGDGIVLVDPATSAATRLRWDRPPLTIDHVDGVATWELHAGPRQRVRMTVTAEPVVDGAAAEPAPPSITARGVTVRELKPWRDSIPHVASTDRRLGLAVDQALADLAALQIRDVDHPERVVVAAGAPWFMTLFGRDSLLTAWMCLPFDALLAPGVLLTLAELQGRRDDPIAEEQPGKILHELRRRGGGGPFSTRQRYYGSVDATPLFVMLVAEAWRWGALDQDAFDQLRPAVEAAVGWLASSTTDGFVTYARRNEHGLANQGWKDSWDGITSADGSLPTAPIALVEVQGYAYAALNAAAEIADAAPGTLDASALRQEAAALKDRFNDTFWDERGWFALGRDGHGRPIDALTTNPGHALWCGLASEEHARTYLDRLGEADLWSGWGLRTLATSMAAYDPLSYHNGSVWPHDTAICAAGAARYGRWDVVDRVVEGTLDAATHFAGRPPELFAGIARDDLRVPVSYPASCSPQAWSSASILLLVRTMLGLEPTPDGLAATRPTLDQFNGLSIDGLWAHGRRHGLRVVDGEADWTVG